MDILIRLSLKLTIKFYIKQNLTVNMDHYNKTLKEIEIIREAKQNPEFIVLAALLCDVCELYCDMAEVYANPNIIEEKIICYVLRIHMSNNNHAVGFVLF